MGWDEVFSMDYSMVSVIFIINSVSNFIEFLLPIILYIILNNYNSNSSLTPDIDV